MTIRNSVATMMQCCVALKIVVANRPITSRQEREHMHLSGAQSGKICTHVSKRGKNKITRPFFTGQLHGYICFLPATGENRK